MSWFKNLDAAFRLMLSFGLLIALIAGISYFSVTSLSQSNDRMATLYSDDMVGAIQADKIAKARLSLGRQGRDAVLNITDPAIVAADKESMVADFAAIHASLDAAEKLFYSKEGIAAMATIRGVLPDWEKTYHEVYERVEARDAAGAKALLVKANQIGQPLSKASEQASAIKEKLGEDKFQANNQAYQIARSRLMEMAVLALVVGVVLGTYIARGLSVPLRQAMGALELLAAGDLTVSVDVLAKDEVGRMGEALNTALEKLRSTLQEVAESAAHSGSSSRELASAADAIASGAQEQAASLEQITATIRQSADNARQASQLALGSRESAEAGQEVVTSAVGAMVEINAASARIADIISTINEIAFQTNLLAVNAAVEAARAGEEGRGFAVVATEVRSLAQRSAESAKEIKGLIQDTLQKVERGSELVNRSGATLQGIVGSVKRVTDIVGEIAAASSEQSTAVTQMDQVTQANSAQTEELASTAQTFADQAALLAQLVGRFKLGSGDLSSRPEMGRKPMSQGPHLRGAPRRGAKAARVTGHGRTRLMPSPVLAGGPADRSDDESFEAF